MFNQAPSPIRLRLRTLAAGLAAAAVLGAAAAPHTAVAADCPAAEASPMQVGNAAAARATLCLINTERRGHGLPALRWNPKLAAAARAHARDMVRRRYFSHTAPEGARLAHRVRLTGYLHAARRWAVGENLGWASLGADSARAMVQAWMNSPPHREAMLRASYRDVGIGVASGVPSDLPLGGSATYAVDFGVTSAEPTSEPSMSSGRSAGMTRASAAAIRAGGSNRRPPVNCSA